MITLVYKIYGRCFYKNVDSYPIILTQKVSREESRAVYSLTHSLTHSVGGWSGRRHPYIFPSWV